ncbi:MAG: aminotransferase class V-fold PLP-dependent enzyme [Phycisphaerales bacterium]|nr:MAG: aminotransferase class V-fold PLP-dependent enzyme [Phycisphaerales bacterium]
MNMRKYLNWLPPRIASKLFGFLSATPQMRKKIDRRYDGILAALQDRLKPYRDSHTKHSSIPETGRGRQEILDEMRQIVAAETSAWKKGFVSGAVYSGDDEHISFLNEVYAIQSQSNPLHPDVWPSSTKYEAEIVAMTAEMLGARTASESTGADKEICGVVTSGGTESILLAVKAYRDRARAVRGVKKPEIIVPSTAHAAFDKAAQYLNVKIIHVPVGDDFAADVEATAKAVTASTIAIAGSAPSFPHGAIDPIARLSELAARRKVGFHTDACLGGFVLPWAKKLGYDVPPFDFELPGVTSISADTHKYGYAPKGTSVLLYKDSDLRHYQYFKAADWPGGLYYSPTLAGSRPGALSAACWAAMVAIGKTGYMQATQKIMQTASAIKNEIKKMSDLFLLGEPLWVIAFGSKTLDIYRVMDCMTTKGWSLNALHKPPCLHLCVTLRHTQPGVAERFVRDLNEAIEHVKANPQAEGGMAPIYGMAATLPVRTVVEDLLDRYIDMLYRV